MIHWFNADFSSQFNFYYNLMQNMRKAIDRGTFDDFRRDLNKNLC